MARLRDLGFNTSHRDGDRYPSVEAAEGALKKLVGATVLYHVQHDVNGHVYRHYWRSREDYEGQDHDRLQLPYEIGC